jgi:hypothetical protein
LLFYAEAHHSPETGNQFGEAKEILQRGGFGKREVLSKNGRKRVF